MRAGTAERSPPSVEPTSVMGRFLLWRGGRSSEADGSGNLPEASSSSTPNSKLTPRLPQPNTPLPPIVSTPQLALPVIQQPVSAPASMSTTASQVEPPIIYKPLPLGAPISEIFVAEDRKGVRGWISRRSSSEFEADIAAVLREVNRRVPPGTFREAHAEYALKMATPPGNVLAAAELLHIMHDSMNGLVRPTKPTARLVGAENRDYVTCYLDALLFAMFAQSYAFDGMLADPTETEPQVTPAVLEGRQRLAQLLRLWVNMLRSGHLIRTDVTRHIQQTLAVCGWTDAEDQVQQDASEAFGVIAEHLGLPLLALRMELFHTGKSSADDDRRVVRERLLDVAIPPPPEDGSAVPLERCVEDYFHGRVEVRRVVPRRSTIGSRSASAISSTLPFRRAKTMLETIDPGIERPKPRRETLIPAWQFFHLLPWFKPEQSNTSSPRASPEPVAPQQNSAPMLGICLKRYFVTNRGESGRLDTQIDVPLEFTLPHFMGGGSDSELSDSDSGTSVVEDGPFKLTLEAVVCHRGKSIDAGHYIALVRPQTPFGTAERPKWLLFDDLSQQRVQVADVRSALKNEVPYLLFYRAVPIESLPSYQEAVAQPSGDSQNELKLIQHPEYDEVTRFGLSAGIQINPQQPPQTAPVAPIARPEEKTEQQEKTGGFFSKYARRMAEKSKGKGKAPDPSEKSFEKLDRPTESKPKSPDNFKTNLRTKASNLLGQKGAGMAALADRLGNKAGIKESENRLGESADSDGSARANSQGGSSGEKGRSSTSSPETPSSGQTRSRTTRLSNGVIAIEDDVEGEDDDETTALPEFTPEMKQFQQAQLTTPSRLRFKHRSRAFLGRRKNSDASLDGKQAEPNPDKENDEKATQKEPAECVSM